MKGLTVFIFSIILSLAFSGHVGKDQFLTDALLREVMDRMGRDLDVAADGYLDSTERGLGGNYLSNRGLNVLENEETGYPLDLEGLDPPSLRDREFLQHSSLWGSQFIGGAPPDGQQRIKPDANVMSQQQMKTDPTLPAYCNPPNPCPVGYTANDGCLVDFENTAEFSRQYQSEQYCMCDREHMFDCQVHDYGSQDLDINSIMNELDIDDHHKNLVAKKFHVKKASNPFLEGEKLPIAAKKGHKLVVD